MEKGCLDVACFWMKEKDMGDLVMAYILYGYILYVLYWRQECNNKVLLGLAVTNIERANGRRQCKEILGD